MEPTNDPRPADVRRRAHRPITTASVAAAFAAAKAGARDNAGRRRNVRPALRITGADGTPLVLNPLPDGSVATVEAADYDVFVTLGLSTRWLLDDDGHGNRTVRFTMPAAKPGRRSNNASVSRVILEAGSGERVRYRDKDPRNLTRANLYLAEGFATGRERALVRSLSQGDEF